MRNAPLVRREMREEKPLICPTTQADFCRDLAGEPDLLERIFEFAFLAHAAVVQPDQSAAVRVQHNQRCHAFNW
jgi:hypothetical protein